MVFGERALRPPRVVFVIGCVSCNKFSQAKLRSIPNFRGLGFFSARASDDLPGIRVEPRPQQRCCGSCLFPRAWLPVPLWDGTSSYA